MTAARKTPAADAERNDALGLHHQEGAEEPRAGRPPRDRLPLVEPRARRHGHHRRLGKVGVAAGFQLVESAGRKPATAAAPIAAAGEPNVRAAQSGSDEEREEEEREDRLQGSEVPGLPNPRDERLEERDKLRIPELVSEVTRWWDRPEEGAVVVEQLGLPAQIASPSQP